MTTGQATLPARPGPRGGRTTSTAFGMGIHLGRIAGIEIRVDVSMLVIAALLTFNLAGGLLPSWHPEWSKALVWTVGIVSAVLFFASILAHELSHALVAKHYGLPVPRITLFIFGGMAELHREPDRPKVELLIAAAGPVLSIALGVAATLGGSFLGKHELGSTPTPETFHLLGPVTTLLLWLGPVNVMLGLFNLVPGFPLDGGRVLRAVLWWKTRSLETATRWATRGGQLVAACLVAAGLLMIFGYRIPFLGVGFGPGLWLVLIGWFLNVAATRSYDHMISQRALSGVRVDEIMAPRSESIATNVPLTELERRFIRSDERCIPVMDGERLRGFVCLEDLRRVPVEAFAGTPVSAVMSPLEELAALPPETPANEALRLLAENDVEELPVLDHGRLLGFVRRRDVLRWLALRTGRREPVA